MHGHRALHLFLHALPIRPHPHDTYRRASHVPFPVSPRDEQLRLASLTGGEEAHGSDDDPLVADAAGLVQKGKGGGRLAEGKEGVGEGKGDALTHRGWGGGVVEENETPFKGSPVEKQEMDIKQKD